MSISSYEGWEPEDYWEYWEGTAMPLGRSLTTDTMTKSKLDATPEAKAIVDVKPIDEFSVTHEPEVKSHVYERPSEIDLALQTLRDRRDSLKEEMRNLRSYPTEDDFEDGTVIIWHEPRTQWGPGLHGVAVKDRQRWYIAGELRSFHWDELVARSLNEVHFSEVEVVHPPEPDED